MDDHDDDLRLGDRLHAAVGQVSASPDLIEVEHGARRLRTRRQVALGVAAAMLVAGAAGAGFGLGRAASDSGGDVASPAAPAAAAPDATGDTNDDDVIDDDAPDDVADAHVTTDGAQPATTDAPTSEVVDPTPVPTTVVDEPATTDVAVADATSWWGEPGWNGEGPEYELVVDRSLEDAGLRLRVHRGETYDYGWPVDEHGWAPARWCYDETSGRAAIAGGDVIDAAWFPYRNLGDGAPAVSVSPVMMGWADGAPHLVLIVQSASATEATVTHEQGADTAAAVDGVIALVVPGAQGQSAYELTVTTPDGPIVLGPGEGSVWDSPEWRASCEPPPPALPEPGEQPADPAAAEAAIRATFDLLYDNTIPHEDKPLHLLDDWTGVDDARAEIAAGSFSDAAATALLTLDELVFTSPTTATYRYSIDASTANFYDRFGEAVEIDGQWSITRQTYCADLSLAGGTCGRRANDPLDASNP